MACFAVPTAASLMVFGGRKAFHVHEEKTFRLGLLLLGGATFGVVDHAWNGELTTLRSESLVSDLLLGVAITATITVAWIAMEALSLAPRPTKAAASA